MRLRRSISLLIAVLLAMISGAGFTSVAPASIGAEAVKAVNTSLAATEHVVTPDGDVVVNGIVSVPINKSEGVRIGNGNDAFTVGLPGDGTSSGIVAKNGVVTYKSPDGQDDTVVPTSNGAQLLKTLADRTAPESFTYPVDLPEGGKVALTEGGPGTDRKKAPAAVILNGSGQAVSFIAAPWAKDANGTDIQTYYTTDGSSLTQHVLHQQQDITYPVVADPHFAWYKLGVVVTFTYNDMVAIAGGGLVAATGLVGVTVPTIVGPVVVTNALLPIVAAASWSVATRSCAWVWIPYPWTLKKPEWGYYDC